MINDAQEKDPKSSPGWTVFFQYHTEREKVDLINRMIEGSLIIAHYFHSSS
jgi:hypothetical protein